jgi:hypothetical protein
MKLSITFEVGEYNGTMGLKIFNNYRLVYSAEENTLLPGNHIIDVEVDSGEIAVEGFGKKENDTLVDDQQNITADKYIDILNISIDFFELKKFHLCHSNKFFDTYFSKNQVKKFNLPNQDDVLNWYLKILEDHK